MNGAVYMSFFQGQLESVLESVVQLAVAEISRTAGSSLSALLLEAAAKEQHGRRLRLQLQLQAAAAGAAAGAGARAEAEPGRRAGGPGGPGGGGGAGGADARRLEQRGRVVDQLKSVMKQVLDFAVRELTKIVEASFDDLLLEIAKMEEEQLALEERLSRGGDGGSAGGGAGVRRRGSENDSVSPSGSEDAEVAASKEAVAEEPARPPVLSVSQDWVPILDKVFAPKWCNDIRQGEGGGGSGRGPGEGRAPPLTLEPSPSSPQQDPRWTPLEDMEVFSPDDDPAESQRSTDGGASGDAGDAGSSGRRSSASMLHRLLTLPSQLMEEEQGAAAAAALASDSGAAGRTRPSPPTAREEEEEEEDEEEDEEEKTRKKKRRRVWSECEECGRRFSRMSLLKAHRQTHFAENAAADTSSPPSPPGGAAMVLRCSRCGKRFSSATRLRSHVQNQH